MGAFVCGHNFVLVDFVDLFVESKSLCFSHDLLHVLMVVMMLLPAATFAPGRKTSAESATLPSVVSLGGVAGISVPDSFQSTSLMRYRAGAP